MRDDVVYPVLGQESPHSVESRGVRWSFPTVQRDAVCVGRAVPTRPDVSSWAHLVDGLRPMPFLDHSVPEDEILHVGSVPVTDQEFLGRVVDAEESGNVQYVSRRLV